jgi:hypothetical protein
MTTARRISLALAAAAIAATAAMAPGSARAAQPFTMHTDATYRIDLAGRRADVSVYVVFTNTTPNTAGHFSLYGSIPISLQAGSSGVAAHDGTGPLGVSVASTSGGTVATVRLRSLLRYGRSTSFTLTYRIGDGSTADVRVRPSMVVLPVWSFGTTGAVAVSVPPGLTTHVSGAAMSSTSSPQGTVLTSGAVADPSRWRSLLTAQRPPVYAAVTRSVPLTGGTVELRVRAWEDDPAWGARTLALAAAALPRLQEVIGLPYTPGGPLVLTESLPADLAPLAEEGLGAREVAVSFAASGFTLLHQLAHLWIASDVASSRWIREGLASLAAARAAPGLKVSLPYDPDAEVRAHPGAAFPLDDWDTAGDSDTQWAYAASWAFMDLLAARVGVDAPFDALRRAAAGSSPYAVASSDAGGTSNPLDSRQLLDQLEEASGVNLDAPFQATIFGDGTKALLVARSASRSSLHALLADGGRWGTPMPVARALEAWQFEDADAAIGEARAWLVERNALVAQAGAAGLTVPGRLMASWRSNGGDARSQAEATAERAVVDAYLAARARIRDPNPVQALGMLGGPRASELLADGAVLFAAGDLQGAVAAIERATDVDAGAQAAGVVRIGIIAALLAVAALLGALALRQIRAFAARRAGAGRLANPPSR